MTEQEKIDRGMQAAALLATPLVKEAFEAMAEMCLAEFAKCGPNDAEQLMYWRRMLETTQDFRDYFEQVVMDGKSAADKAEYQPFEVV